MTHTQLIRKIAKTIDLKPEEVAILWQQTSHILMKELSHHEKVRIKNFGAFVTVKHKSRTVPDPRQMSKKLVIFDQYLPKFRPSEQLRAEIKDVRPKRQELDTELQQNTNIEAEDTESNYQTISQTIKTKSEEPKAKKLSKASSIGYIDLSSLTIDKEILDLIPFNIAHKYQLAPIEKKEDELIVAMIDPGDKETIDIIERQTNLKVIPKITTAGELSHILDQYNVNPEVNDITDSDEATSSAAEQTKEEAAEELANEEAPATKVVSSLLERAVREHASDIHIEPEEKRVVVRFRIDGLLQQVLELPKNIQAAVISRLKIMSNLKIDEARLPQDGRLRMVIDRNEIDFRLSTLPTVNGEKVVMRILDKSAGILSFEELGLRDINLDRVSDNITKAHGMTLVTGPTGSGKTTTLYAVLGKIMTPTINIVTLEDPVEYRIPGVNQSQVNSAIGFDFSSGLRTIVRQDPDVILIGEIRDLETATMAIHSALTGHVVLSTLHTNDAAGAIPRLIDMGIEPFLITSSTNAIVAQRLVRKICEHCKEKITIPEEALTEIKTEIDTIPQQSRPKNLTIHFFKGKGCSQCNKSGYSGRLGIFETLSVTESIKQLALKRVSASELTKEAINEGMITLKQDGLLKAFDGLTTLEEVWRVTKD